MLSLNVGCGLDSWGDVRVDVAFVFVTWHLRPTVLAHACYLPFRDGSFEMVKSSHMLEHLENPVAALDEIIRVSSKKIFLRFPTQYDVLPWLVSSILPIPNFSTLRLACITRKKSLHKWIINPRIIVEHLRRNSWEASCEMTTVSLFAALEHGRKAKYFRWITKHFRIPFEYVIAAKSKK